MRTDSATPSGESNVFAVIAWLAATFLGGWLAWCAYFQLAGVPVDAEITSLRVEQHRSRRGRKTTHTYGIVRYADQTGKMHTDEVELYGHPVVGRKTPVRYLPSRPDDCRRDDFWEIWGLAVMISGFFALFLGLIWIGKWARRNRDEPRNPFQPPSS